MSKTAKSTEIPTEKKLLKVYYQFKYDFADVLGYWIEDRRISKKDLASKLNVHASAISHWLNGSRLPGVTELYTLTKTLALVDKDRSELMAAWHLSLLSDDLREYYEYALQNEDEAAARQIFVDLLQQNWGDFYIKEWQEEYISIVQPEVYETMLKKAEEDRKIPKINGMEYIATLEKRTADLEKQLADCNAINSSGIEYIATLEARTATLEGKLGSCEAMRMDAIEYIRTLEARIVDLTNQFADYRARNRAGKK